MIYAFLKFVFKYAIRKYFSSIEVMHLDRIPTDKPVLLLPNHRSAFMDPIVVSCHVKQHSYFLVRGESFRNPTMIKIFKRLKMIPIFRKEYDPDKVQENEKIFEHCFELLENKGTLMIFPEGLCQTKHLLSPIKPGTARIALGAESKNGFNLDLHIIPIGINYTNPHRFRSKLTLNIGEPILLKSLKDDYIEDPWKCVQTLTSKVSERLSKLIITIDEQEEAKTIDQMELLLKSGNDHQLTINSQDWVTTKQTIIANLASMKKTKPLIYSNLKERLNRFTQQSHRLHITKSNAESLPASKRVWVLAVKLIVGFPFFIIGFALHFIPFLITKHSTKKIVKRVDFMGSAVLALGSAVFVLNAAGLCWLCQNLFGNTWITLSFFILLPNLGLWAYAYLKLLREWRETLGWMRLGKRNHGLQSYFKQERKSLLKIYSSFMEETTQQAQL
ncbi:MAG: glycerol-3-phosphate O-acyltransferase/dihydroxyacetone phosphate acyltransferase [Bacteroidia bacterium]|jgi:glycerol-3-phosphate O-acyltransferase/dihydroxyacetone phosphate acyltransferase